MKCISKALVLFCFICALFVFPATATSNENLPSKDETNQIISDANTDNALDVYNYVKEKGIATNCDLWKCSTCSGDTYAVSFYYKDSTASKGYGSQYFKDGGAVPYSSLRGYSLEDSYKGEESNKENVTEDVKQDEKNVSEEVSNDNKFSWNWFRKDKDTSNDQKENEYQYKIVTNNKTEYPNDYLDVAKDDLSNNEKIETFLHYYSTGKMDEDSVRECLNHLWGDE
ncbi:MAG: hypothetical protein ABFD07_02630 [Methanobacterium sp.]